MKTGTALHRDGRTTWGDEGLLPDRNVILESHVTYRPETVTSESSVQIPDSDSATT